MRWRSEGVSTVHYWTGRRWREAGEAHEALVGTRWQRPEGLSDRDRLDVLRAAVAYSLGDEKVAAVRLCHSSGGR